MRDRLLLLGWTDRQRDSPDDLDRAFENISGGRGEQKFGH
jgi:hypothetical protein